VLLDDVLTIHGDGAAARDFTHVVDTCRAIDLILQAPGETVHGEVFNLASGQHRSIVDVARDVVTEMGYAPDRMQFIGNRPGQWCATPAIVRRSSAFLDGHPNWTGSKVCAGRSHGTGQSRFVVAAAVYAPNSDRDCRGQLEYH